MRIATSDYRAYFTRTSPWEYTGGRMEATNWGEYVAVANMLQTSAPQRQFAHYRDELTRERDLSHGRILWAKVAHRRAARQR